ncbi:MAG: ABC transporter ATP-binding protein [Lachnospiraceae bacterium]|nr:ABC transporter ATP-binding protein [Lachnospiraceae bacterium]
MIVFEDVSFKYAQNTEENSLVKYSMHIKKGECVLVCGPSGCGKSTVIRMVNGLIPHYYEGKMTGNVKINGKTVADEELYDMAKLVGTVFQNPRTQFFNVDTTSELVFGCENMGLKKEEILSRLDSVADKAAVHKLMDRNIFKLSGGEKQKIACASVMTSGPDIIVLDEPSSNLDYSAIVDLERMIEMWKNEGKTILIAEHRLAYCMKYADKVIIMNHGKKLKELGKEEFCRFSDDELHEMGLRSLKNTDSRRMSIYSDTRNKMVMNNLRFGYDKKNKILDFDKIEIPAGEIVALVGANGVGKTTFLRCLCGMEKRCKAVLQYGMKHYNAKQRMKLMYLVMQDVNHQLFAEDVLDEVLISMADENEEKAMEILKMLDLEEVAQRHPVSLSGGQKQRVAVASAIAAEREILLFDEPTSGLDYGHMIQVAKLLKGLKEFGKTVIVVTHDAELIENCCTAVINLEALKNVNNK